ncbi:hypothetical protein F442_20320 [Phytophthora nicotianae P10297]|uniref:Uncharacterized protein n=1 Tax=Phytophthora nicotianae P10297 TaxID=1317064 RepID=W2Y981_PHYNI|nr:hypothetical protein F442_20320 [Phytophthora nicotianae P10297]
MIERPRASSQTTNDGQGALTEAGPSIQIRLQFDDEGADVEDANVEEGHDEDPDEDNSGSVNDYEEEGEYIDDVDDGVDAIEGIRDMDQALRGSEDDTRPLRDNGGDRDVRVHQDQRYSTVINLSTHDLDSPSDASLITVASFVGRGARASRAIYSRGCDT